MMIDTNTAVDEWAWTRPPELAQIERPLRFPQIAVVVATQGQLEPLRRCIYALLHQTLSPCAYEIIVVDDAHSDEVLAMVGDLAHATAGAPVLRYLRPAQAGCGSAAARDCGWQMSEAPLIAFAEEGDEPDPTWLMRGWRAVTPGAGGFGREFVERETLASGRPS